MEYVILNISGEIYFGHIEERILGQWPEKRTDMFIIVHGEMPRFPIPIDDFKKHYGTINIIKMSNIKENKIEKALIKCLSYLADLNGSEWIKGKDIGALEMKARAKALQQVAYDALYPKQTPKSNYTP